MIAKNKIDQTGSGNIALSDIHDSEINIIIGKSPEYNELLEKLATQKKLLSRTPEEETEERLEISKKINTITDAIEQFKRDVLKLAEQFNRIEINTDRLQCAKEFFERGKFSEARAVFDTERKPMRDEKSLLVAKRDDYKTDTLPKLKSLAEQFFIRIVSSICWRCR